MNSKHFTGRACKLAPWHPARDNRTEEQKAFFALSPRQQDTMRTAQSIANARVRGERQDAAGRIERAAKARAEEQDIINNARNFKMTLPTEEQIQTEMTKERARLAEMDRKRAEEEAELAE